MSPLPGHLRADLAANPSQCVLAYWHKPRWASGENHGSHPEMQTIWQIFYEAGAELVINGHEHNYERFEPQNPEGGFDPQSCIRQFVVGTGGMVRYSFGPPIANSIVRESDTFGVLKLTLHSGSYSWEFIPEAGKAFVDSGTASCVE